jgi:hypothetical protein
MNALLAGRHGRSVSLQTAVFCKLVNYMTARKVIMVEVPETVGLD